MNQAQFRMLTAAEQTLIVSTESKRLGGLDEDALLHLHDRVRRARATSSATAGRGQATRASR